MRLLLYSAISLVSKYLLKAANQKDSFFSHGDLNMCFTVLLLNATYVTPLVVGKERSLLKIIIILLIIKTIIIKINLPSHPA